MSSTSETFVTVVSPRAARRRDPRARTVRFARRIRPIVLLALALTTTKSVSAAIEMHGSGSSSPSTFFWKVMDLLEERAKEPISMTYRSVGAPPANLLRDASSHPLNSVDGLRFKPHPVVA